MGILLEPGVLFGGSESSWEPDYSEDEDILNHTIEFPDTRELGDSSLINVSDIDWEVTSEALKGIWKQIQLLNWQFHDFMSVMYVSLTIFFFVLLVYLFFWRLR